MRTTLVTAPTEDVISLTDVKKHLVVEHDEHDALIRTYIAAAVGEIDPAAGGRLGRALRTQTWMLQLDGFPCGPIELPYPPLQQVTEVAYTDTAGVDQTLASGTGYRVIGGAGDVVGKAAIAPPYDGAWPVSRCDYAAVRITFRCGHPAPAQPDAADSLPGPLRAWLLMAVGTLYANRESISGGANGGAQTELPHIRSMLATFRVY